MPQSPHRLRNDLKCVEWDVKPYTTNLSFDVRPFGPQAAAIRALPPLPQLCSRNDLMTQKRVAEAEATTTKHQIVSVFACGVSTRFLRTAVPGGHANVCNTRKLRQNNCRHRCRHLLIQSL